MVSMDTDYIREKVKERGEEYLAKYLFSVHMKDEEIAVDNGIARFPFWFLLSFHPVS